MQDILLKILFTSDIHGCFFPYDFLHGKEATASLCSIQTYVNKQREEYGDGLILLDAGDFFEGQPTCFYSNHVNKRSESLAASIVNYMGYDCIAVGNHDIEACHDIYDEYFKQMNSPVVCANILQSESEETYFLPYSIIEKRGIRIAIVGMSTAAVPYWLDEKRWSGMRFESVKQTASSIVKRIREEEKPDFVVGLFHSGWDGGIDTLGIKENETKETALSVEGFDVILYGHDHKAHCNTIKGKDEKNVLCLNPASEASFIGDVEIKYNPRTKLWHTMGRLIPVSEIRPDEEMCKAFAKEFSLAKDYMNETICHLNSDIRSRDCCFGDAPLSAFLHHVQLRVTGADISFAAPLCFDETIASGCVKRSDVFRLFKYDNDICGLKMTGREIKNYLEMSYDLWINTMTKPSDHIMKTETFEYEGKEYTFFKNLVFNFDTAAGINYTVDVTKQYGQRIRITSMQDGREFSLDDTYTVAMHSYRANGGTEFLTIGARIPREELNNRRCFVGKYSQRRYVMECLMLEEAEMFLPMNNWRFVPEEWTKPAIERDRAFLFGA